MIFERKTVVVGWDVVYGNLDCEGRSVVSQELIYTANTKEAAEEFLTTRGWKKGSYGSFTNHNLYWIRPWITRRLIEVD